MTVTIALAGNPNVGKSTIFNALTGSRQHVGNWPGKTVAKKEGTLTIGENDILVVDLPGTYSLTAYSVEEIITRDFIINEQPTAVITVVDASNLERNLYLVAQLIELEMPVIIVLNMTDIAESRGLHIDAGKLSARLGGIPVIESVGNRNLGLEQLKEAIVQVSQDPPAKVARPQYDDLLQAEIDALAMEIAHHPSLAGYYPTWLATKLLEEDPAAVEIVGANGSKPLMNNVSAAQARIEMATGEDAEILIADRRYEFIGQIIDAVQERPSHSVITLSDKIDNIVTHRIIGLPIFLLIMWTVFQFTANVSTPYLDWVDGFMNGTISGWAAALLTAVGLGGTWVSDLLTDGIIAGVGGVLVFVPVLIFLYMALGLLEDSGYMTRAAFVMDRFMRLMGLHGKSFLPMIVGFGCTVPAIYATRSLENEKDRKLTGFLATFMSCGARLPVYILFGAAFFGASSVNLVFAMYLLGIGIALAVGFAFKHTIYKGKKPAPFVMEMPPYRIPHPIDVWRQTWERTKGFIRNAGTIILAVSILFWFLMAIPAGRDGGSFNDVNPADSLFGAASGAVAPIFIPAGFGSWQASGSLVGGFLAKEIIVSSMNQIYVGSEGNDQQSIANDQLAINVAQDVEDALISFGEAGLLTVQELANILPRTVNLLPGVQLVEFDFLGREELVEDTGSLQSALVASFAKSAGSAQAAPIAAVAFTVFVLLYVPCMSAVSAMRQEFGSRWMLAQVAFTLLLAWITAVLVFQLGKLIIL
jgi:ferrous iron transport protein B